MSKPEIRCSACGEVMIVKVKYETGNCDCGCCPDYLLIYQCPKCKNIESSHTP